jgi:sugar (pentulose or hexulose) kinase
MRDRSPVVAALDLGKTNLKVVVATPEGRPLETLQTPHQFILREPYLSYDLAAVTDWFIDALGTLGLRHAIDAVVPTAHGCGGVLVDDLGPVLPMMDYECPTPAEIDSIYAAEGPSYGEVFCSPGAGAMRIAKQLLWQSRGWPEAFARAKMYLTTAQFLAWRLGGRPASEISQMAAQGHIWNPRSGGPSAYAERHGWHRLFPPFARAGEVLGQLEPELALRTGLPRSVEILCGVHDSNANLFRYTAAGLKDRAVLSTGTWMIAFVRGLGFDALQARRAMVSNLDVDGEPVASTLTMTGREYAMLLGEGTASDEEAMAAIPALLARGVLALPSFVPDDGAFFGSGGGGQIQGPPPRDAAERRGLATLYAAFTAHVCLSALGADSPVVVDGGFAPNSAFCRVLAALRAEQPVWASQSRDGTALGAALLWKRFERTQPVQSVALDLMSPAFTPGLDEAYASWVERADALGAGVHLTSSTDLNF